jgi:hypothetical protein
MFSLPTHNVGQYNITCEPQKLKSLTWKEGGKPRVKQKIRLYDP